MKQIIYLLMPGLLRVMAFHTFSIGTLYVGSTTRDFEFFIFIQVFVT